jgi:D-alanine-D-alanine ligase
MTLPMTAVAVLLGGPSAEHDVSLVSGRAIATALAGAGVAVEGWLIDLDSQWWSLPPSALDSGLPPEAFRDVSALGAAGPHTAASALEQLARRDRPPVVFPAMHGPFGEDGQVQSLLESVGLIYCGAGPGASALGMDKSLFKRICGALELPVLPWMDVSAAEYSEDPGRVRLDLAAFAEQLPDPRLMVKPLRLGSSIGITIVQRPGDPAELGAAIEAALRHDEVALAEPYLDHPRELEVGILGNRRGDIAAYGPGEIVPDREFYDYVAKYGPGGESRTVARARLETEMADAARAAAIEVFLAIGASGFGRVDFLLAQDEMLFISEINTIPGFTPISLFPRMCAEGGYDFGGVCVRIVELALERAAWRPSARVDVSELP